MARIQEAMLADDAPRVVPSTISEADLTGRFGLEIGPVCWREFAAKRVAEATAPAFSAKVATRWDDIRDRVRRAIIPASRIEATLKRAGAPTTPADIGLSQEFYATAVRNARFLRDRYTFLDLADDSGMLARLWPT